MRKPATVWVVVSIFISISVICPTPGIMAATFQGIGDLPGGSFSSRANAVSHDGSVVVGESSSSSGDYEAFRWTSDGGIEGLGDFPGGDFHSRAHGVSADGSYIVGVGINDITSEAFRWTSSGGMEGLGFVSDPPGNSYAASVSSDGSIVVGGSRTYTGGWPPFRAFHWEGGIMTAYAPISGFTESQASDVSSDGQVIVGGVHNNMVQGQMATWWAPGGTMIALDHLPGMNSSWSYSVSLDGSIAVGYSASTSYNTSSTIQATRWTIGGSVEGLGFLGGGLFSAALATSSDGSVVVGHAYDVRGAQHQAIIWDEVNGMRSLQGVLEAQGVDLTGWTLTDAMGVSADGLTIVGYGINPSGYTEAWIATLGDPDTTPPDIYVFAPEPYGLYPEGDLVLAFLADDDVSGNIEPPALWGTLEDAVGDPVTVYPGHIPGAGVYSLAVSAEDEAGNYAESEPILFVVYDPTDGFVTGGGWIDSPEGAYRPDPPLTGTANFGFVSKYKKGATAPTGNTTFVFQMADLNFHSSSYDWLVVTGSDYARFKGWGSVNGQDGYQFMLWAGDGDYDTFRMKIWWEEDGIESVLYDNGMDQPIGGGSIVIHTN